MQIFPLEADGEQLQDLCSAWFNSKIPPEVAFFRPSLPVVFCSVLHYEDMGDAFQSETGILAQDEIYFLVPLERYRLENGRLSFVEHGAFTPYIFVDSPESVSFGREHFGFPKELCAFRPGGPQASVPWEVSGQDILTVDTWQPTRRGTELRPLVTISRPPLQRFDGFDLPQRGSIGAHRGSRRARILWWLQNLSGELRRAQSYGLRPFPQLGATNLVDLFLQAPIVSCYNLRQSPHPHDTRRALHRDLVNVRLQTRAVTGIRLFRELAPGLDDVTISIRRTNVLPIVDRLGLRVRRRSQFEEDGSEGIADAVDAISPLFVQTDFVLEASRRVVWQFEGRPWQTPEHPISAPDRSAPTPPPFDEYIGSAASLLALSPSGGGRGVPRDYKLMLLAAHADRLQRTIDRHFWVDGTSRLEILRDGDLTPVRLLWRRSRAPSSNGIEGLAWTGGAYLSISTVVRFEHEGQTQYALLLLRDFADNPFIMQMSNGLYGSQSFHAHFKEGDGAWFASSMPASRSQVVSTTLLGQNRVETRFEMQPWLEVVTAPQSPKRGERSALTGFVDRFSEEIAEIRSMLVVGGISDPETPGRWAERRVTRIDFRREWVVPPRRASTDRDTWLSAVRNRAQPLRGAFGLIHEEVELPGPSALPASERRHNAPVLASWDGAGHIALEEVRILWSRRGPQRRTFLGSTVGVPRGGDRT